MMNTYLNWFKKVINVLIELILFFAIIATLYVFTSVFSGTTRILLFGTLIVIYGLVIYFFKTKIKTILNKIINCLTKTDTKTMIIILVLTMIILKTIYAILFFFDVNGGDVSIYMDIADQIVNTGNLHSDAISHLFGAGIHFAIFKYLNLPIHIGMFIVFFIGTIINFVSFKDIIGKEKAFIVVMLYILMPSSILLTFCPTHEIFLYMYLSILIYVFNKLLKEENKLKIVLFSLLSIICSILACLVNPSGYIIWIIMALVILLSKVKANKKLIVIFTLLLSILGSNLLTRCLDVNEHVTTMNTYTILIHGSNPESLGEQVDGYPLKQMRMYIYDTNKDFSDASFENAGKNVLLNQYGYLLSHPINLLELVAHKFYILWSGNHYSIEMASTYNGINNIEFYIFLAISTLIYLFILTVGLVYSKKKEDEIYVSNYKLAILGCFAVTMLSIVTNKYSLYVTLFIYLISFYKIDIDENK